MIGPGPAGSHAHPARSDAGSPDARPPEAGLSGTGLPGVGLPGVGRPDASPPRPAGEPGAGAFDLEISVTGQPPVDAALTPLAELGAHPIAAHVAIYERVHASLREVLDELDRAH